MSFPLWPLRYCVSYFLETTFSLESVIARFWSSSEKVSFGSATNGGRLSCKLVATQIIARKHWNPIAFRGFLRFVELQPKLT